MVYICICGKDKLNGGSIKSSISDCISHKNLFEGLMYDNDKFSSHHTAMMNETNQGKTVTLQQSTLSVLCPVQV